MIRTEALKKIGGYQMSFLAAEDTDLWLRLLRIGNIVNISKPLLRYREHGNNISVIHREKQKLSTIAAQLDDLYTQYNAASSGFIKILDRAVSTDDLKNFPFEGFPFSLRKYLLQSDFNTIVLGQKTSKWHKKKRALIERALRIYLCR